MTHEPARIVAAFSLPARRMRGKGRGKEGFLRSLCFLLFLLYVPAVFASDDLFVLRSDSYADYIKHFNTMEDENITNFVSNAQSWDWLHENIPFFECPDKEVEEMYYFRWWSFRKHIVETPQGFVITEFLTPVSHAGVFNTISCAAGFHLVEGRWLHDERYLNDYTRFWFHGENGKSPRKFHNFSNWLAAAAYDRFLVNDDKAFIAGLLNDLIADYGLWEQERQLPNGLFWQYDVRDGMEESISGSRTAKNVRPTINSYMFANARAIAAIAGLANRKAMEKEFVSKADQLKQLIQDALWDKKAKFFKVLLDDGRLSDAREEIGFIPWMFELPDTGRSYEAAWAQLTDPQGFRAPFGITTAERRSPQFRSHGVGTCEWDGAVWPFATSQTLYALANSLRDYRSSSLSPVGGEGQGEGAIPIAARDYFDAFLTYVHSQHANGKPYIGEYLDEVTGDWINRGDRSRYYNHSTFADLLITGILGLRPRADNTVEVYPLLPQNTWDWFCLDGVKYHGHMLTIVWDKHGTRYQQGSGLTVLVDGKEVAKANELERVTGKLP